MGAGRKTETYTLNTASSVNCSLTARNLRKSELGGVVFGASTIQLKSVFSNNCLEAIWCFEAASEGRLNINPHGWTVDESECTPFAAQVRFQTRMECKPLLEDQFGPIIANNYYEPKLFWFELDRDQTNKLISMFSSSPTTVSSALPTSSATQSTLFNAACSSDARLEDGGSERPILDVNVANRQQPNIEGGQQEHKMTHIMPYSGRLYSSIVKNNDHPRQVHVGCSSLATHGLDGENESSGIEQVSEHCIKKSNVEDRYLPAMTDIDASLSHLVVEGDSRSSYSNLERPYPYCSIVKDRGSCQKKWSGLFENSITSDERLEVLEVETPDSELNLPTADQFNTTLESLYIRSQLDEKCNSLDGFKNDSGQFDEKFECLKLQMEDLYLSVTTEDYACLPHSAVGASLSIADARWEGRYLETGASEGNSSRSDKSMTENSCLSETDVLLHFGLSNHKLFVAKILQELNKFRLYQFKQDQKISYLEKELVESRREIKSLKQHLKASESSSLEELVIKSESGGGESILIVGGFDGSSFLSALDCYHPSYDKSDSLCPMTSWVTSHPLNRKRGSLAGISLNEKIYAIGGGDGVECFSEVEMFDLDVGRWIPSRSMLDKRFSPAVAEINGMVYVVGGYDGKDYLKYAMGGYNGELLVSTVEVFDPRMGCWMAGGSMNDSRGYSAAVVIGNSIFVMAA